MLRLFLLIIAAILCVSCASSPTGNSMGYSHSRQWDPESLEAINFNGQEYRK